MPPLDAAVRPHPRALPTAAALGTFGSLVRFSALGGSAILPLVGLASAGADSASAVVLALVLGIAFHVFAYVLNDVVDLPIDQTDPRRARSPLVTGVVSPPAATGLAVAMLAVAAVAAGQGGMPAVAALLAAAIGLGAYDLIGKRTRWPPAADLVQALGWGSLVLAGSLLDGRPSALTLAVAGYVVVFIVMANGVHGALRDLPNDSRHGVPTTAALLGAGIAPDGRRRLSRRLVAWAWTLQVTMLAIAGLAIGVGGSPLAAVPAAASALLLAGAPRAATDDELLAGGMLHLLVALAVPVVLVLSTPAPAVPGALIVAVYVLPLLTHGWLPGALAWGAGRTAAAARTGIDFIVLTRPHNAAAAGLAVVVGAHLGGRTDLVSEPVLRAALAATLVVAAANVANDLADVAEDRINRPARPIVAGRVGRRSATWFAALLAIAALVLVSSLGAIAAAVTLGLAATGVLYSIHLKGRPGVGNLAVAALSASTIPFGAIFLAQPAAVVALAAVVVFVSILASEVLKATADREGDLAAGRRTTATALPLERCVRLHAVLVIVLAALIPIATVTGVAPPAFAVAGIVGIAVPQLAIAARVQSADGPGDIRRVLPLSKVAWFAGLASLLFLT